MVKLLRKLRDRYLNFYHRSSIQLILSLSFTAVAVVGTIILGFTLFFRFYTTTDQQMAENNQRIVNQVNFNLNAQLHQMMNISDTIYYSVLKNTDLAEEKIDNQLALLYGNSKDTVVSIALFTDLGHLVSATPLSTLKPTALPQTQSWFTAAMVRTENLHFSTPHVQNLLVDANYAYNWVISLSRHVELTRNGGTQDGILLVDMSYAGIEQICKNVDLPFGGYLYLVDDHGEIIYHPQQQLIYAGLASENNQKAAQYEDGFHQEDFDGQTRQITVKTVGYTGWKLVAVTPVNHWGGNYGQPVLFFLFVIFFSIFLMIFMNSYLSERISGPIKELDKSIKALERGVQDVDFTISGPYEIERLSHSIGSMVSTLHHLMDDIIQQEEEKRRSELDVLHAQINPHFLYNTLDSVVRMTETGHPQEAVLMITSLARLFRISLSQGQNLIPIATELEHARHYLTIQQMRYKDKFTATIELDDDVKQLYTAKLIVQPILENAIYHGMDYADGDGTIHIHGYRQGDDVLIDVTDNGPGMPPHVVEQLLADGYQSPHSKGSGIGFKNVHQRIRLTFGQDYGLHIDSEPDAGTTVRIRLPVVTTPPGKKEGLQ